MKHPTSMQWKFLAIAEIAIAAWENEQFGDTDWRKPLDSNPDATQHQIAASRLLNERRLRLNDEGVMNRSATDWVLLLGQALGVAASEVLPKEDDGNHRA